MTLVMTRATKQAARYTDAGGRERCSACRFFMPQGTCGRIIGPGSPGGWCRFYSQEAVQRWQPQGAQGQGGSPTLDLSFTSGSGVLDSRIVFTRASTATYFDSGGTLQTATSGTPRFDYDPVTHALRGLLIEEARTNGAINSGRLDNASWVQTNHTVTATATGAPDGTTNGTKVTPTAVSSNHATQAPSIPVVAGSANTWSIFAKAAGYPRIFMSFSNGAQSNGFTATFNLTTGIASAIGYIGLGSGGSVQMTNVGNGWYRCAISGIFDGTSGASAAIAYVDNGTTNIFTGDGTSGVYLWGGQVEAGAFPTSYIPTTAAAVTRAIEICQVPIGAWFNPNTYSLSLELDLPVVNSTYGGICDTVIGNASWFTNSTWTRAGAGTPSSTPLTAGAINKTCGTINVGVLMSICTNGGAIGSSASTGAAQTTATRLAIGNDPWSLTTAFNGRMRRVRCWSRILTNAEMQQVTT